MRGTDAIRAATHARPASAADHERPRGEPSYRRPAGPGRRLAPTARILRGFQRVHPIRIAFALALWGGWYAAYRLYYAFGGDAGMIGQPRSPALFREINLRGGVIILIAALLPPIAASAWRRPRVRRLVAVLSWIAFVGCCIHAVANEILRLLSLADVHPVELSPEFWLSVNRRTADLQDVLLNEPWFFVEGCLWGLFALKALPRSTRPRWLRIAAIAVAVGSTVGVLSGVGLIPTVRVG